MKPRIPLTSEQQALVEQWRFLPAHVLRSILNGKFRHARQWNEWDDYMQDGILGLIRAAQIYDGIKPSPKTGKPVLFKTYAYSAIRRQILDRIKEGGVIYTPHYTVDLKVCDQKKRELAIKAHGPLSTIPKDLASLEREELPTRREARDPLDCLPLRFRFVLEQLYFHGETKRTLGVKFGISRQAVANRSRRAIKMIQAATGS